MSHPSIRALCVIPARGGSKRIPGKNIRSFCGTPLIARAVQQAKGISWFDRVIVDTDDQAIADVGIAAGAEVPFLRPAELATDKAMMIDSLLNLLERLEKDEGYLPEYLCLLQTTSPLREAEDIEACRVMMEKTHAKTVLTVCPTHPRLYHLDEEQRLILVNGNEGLSTNAQAWPPAYVLNGCFVYLVRVDALRAEKRIITDDTRGVICPAWRSVDLDTPEDWVMAEHLFKHKDELTAAMKAEGVS